MECKYCGRFFEGKALGGHTARCSERPNHELELMSRNISLKLSGKVLSDSTKKKISESRIAYLKANPDKVPYKLNHKHKQTYPETYFKECLQNFVYQYRIPETLYEGDFVNPHSKVIIEIDGEQHYVDSKIVEHDIKRTNRLEELGWKIIRVRWRDFIRLDRDKKDEIISNLNKESIEDFNIDNYIKVKRKCIDCSDILKYYKAIRCPICANKQNGINSRHFEISKAELEKLLSDLPMTTVGKMFGVSGNSIKKRCIKLEIPLTRTRH